MGFFTPKGWGGQVKEAHKRGHTEEAKAAKRRKADRERSKRLHKQARKGSWGWK